MTEKIKIKIENLIDAKWPDDLFYYLIDFAITYAYGHFLWWVIRN